MTNGVRLREDHIENRKRMRTNRCKVLQRLFEPLVQQSSAHCGLAFVQQTKKILLLVRYREGDFELYKIHRKTGGARSRGLGRIFNALMAAESRRI